MKTSLRLSMGFILAFAAASLQASESARDVMQQVFDRYQGETRISTMSLATCPYDIVNGKIVCTASPRQKTMQSVQKNYGKNLENVKAFTLILEPSAEKGISILQYDYDKKGQDTDQWLYLPALGRVKRVASDGDSPKKGSLFGSEFSLEDIEKPKLEDYNYALLKEDTWNGSKVWVIEQTPTKQRSVKTNYSKKLQYVDRERLVILKTDYYGWNGSLIKTSYKSKLEKINDIWTAREDIMRNFETNRISILMVDAINYNLAVKDDMLTQRILVDSAFRKRHLMALNVRSDE